MQESVIRLEHITREFPGVLANDDVSLEIRRGEVFALVGENGAGKSTLMNIIYGIFPPTDGSVYIRGKKVETFSPKNSIEMGIGMVHQHFMLVPSFTVAQNIVMSREPRRAGIFFDNKRAEEITRELVDEYGLYVDPSAPVQDVSVGVQQRVEILKALYRGADILILDEPTAVLTPQETAELFRVIRHIIEEKNMTVILITHKLGEVMAISDRVGIMRQGRLVGLSDTKDITEKQIASMMVGRPVLFDKLEKTGAGYQIQCMGATIPVTDEMAQKLASKGQGNADVIVGVRPEHIMLCDGSVPHFVRATVDVSEMMGSSIHLHVNAGGKDVVLVISTVDLPEDHKLGYRYGESVDFTFSDNVIHVFDRESGKALT